MTTDELLTAGAIADAELVAAGYGVPDNSPLVLPPPSDPMAVARAVVDNRWRCAVGRLVLRHWRATFQRWEGTHWCEIEEGAVRSELYKTLEAAECADSKGQLHPWTPSRRKVTDVLDALRAVTFLPETIEQPSWLEGAGGPPAAELVAVRNGLLHVPTRRLHGHDARFFNRVAVPFDHDSSAPAPERWLDFLARLWPDDPDAPAALAEFFGYVLSGDTSLHKILLMVGPTRAGKGVIARVLTALVGRHNVAGPTLASLGQNFGLAPLIGKPLAVVTDARLGGAGTHVVVERLLSISGEDALTVDRKFREPWTGKLGTRFMVVSNELPRFGDSSRAIARRFIVLILRRSWLGRENPALTRELLDELPGVLNWALDGLDRLHARGRFTEPAASIEAVVALEDLASPVAAFVRDRCTVDLAAEIPVDDLYRAWRSWCTDQGRDKPGSAQIFGRDLRAVVPTIRMRRPRDGDARQRLYEGIALCGWTRNEADRGPLRTTDELVRDGPRSNPLWNHPNGVSGKSDALDDNPPDWPARRPTPPEPASSPPPTRRRRLDP